MLGELVTFSGWLRTDKERLEWDRVLGPALFTTPVGTTCGYAIIFPFNIISLNFFQVDLPLEELLDFSGLLGSKDLRELLGVRLTNVNHSLNAVLLALPYELLQSGCLYTRKALEEFYRQETTEILFIIR